MIAAQIEGWRIALAAALALIILQGCHRPRPLTALEDEAPLVIRGAALFTGAGAQRAAPADVWIEADRIASITPLGARPAAAGVVEIDGRGMTLLPGLIDVNVHLSGSAAPPWDLEIPDRERAARRLLWAGITTALDVGGDLAEVADLRARMAAGRVAGPQILATGPYLTVPGGHPRPLIETLVPRLARASALEAATIPLESAEDAQRAARMLADGGALAAMVVIDDIPLGAPHLSGALLAETVKAAHGSGLRVVAQVGTAATTRLAVTSGVDLIVHGPYRDALDEAEAHRLLRERVAVAPTLGMIGALDELAHGGLELAPLQRALGSPEVVEALLDPPEQWAPALMRPWLEAVHAHRGDAAANLRTLRSQGAMVVVGSDSPSTGWEAGAGMHGELERLVAAGIPPGEVLRWATAVNAEALALGDRGRVAAGMRADLLLVRGDPTADIAAVHAIEAVILGGRRVSRAPLSGPR